MVSGMIDDPAKRLVSHRIGVESQREKIAWSGSSLH